MVLYNKHTGLMRVFYYIAPNAFNEDYNNAKIRVEFNELDVSKNESANFNHMEEVPKPVDLYNKKQNESVPNTINGGLGSNNGVVDCHKGQWMQADFIMAYDPCVCEYSYRRFKIQLNLAKNAVINLTGDLTTNVVNNPSNAGTGTANWQSQYKTGFTTATGTVKNAKTYYKSSKDAAVPVYKAIKKLTGKKEAMPVLIDVLSEVPYLGAAIGVFNYFMFKKADDGKSAPGPVTYNSTVNISGNITDSVWLTPINLEVPGSQHTSSTSVIGDIPLYDEPLGVVSLLNTPRVEYSHIYAGNSSLTGPYPMQFLPVVTEYKIVDPLELVVNPSSELTLVEAKASVVLTYNSTNQKDFENDYNKYSLLHYPYIAGATLPIWGSVNPSGVAFPSSNGKYSHADWLKTDRSGANLELIDSLEFYKVSYGQAPLSCFSDKSFYLISRETPAPEGLPTLVVRLNLTMQDANGRYYKFVQSYEIDKHSKMTEIERELQYYAVSIEETPVYDPEAQPFSSHFNTTLTLGNWIGTPANNYLASSANKPDFVFLENETVSGFVDAWDGIIIGDNVTIQPGTWLTAGRYITASPENKYNPEIKMQIGIRDETCLEDPNLHVVTDETALSSFCKGASKIYNPVTAKRNLITDDENRKDDKLYSFNLYPNPTDDLVNVEVELKDGANYTIEMLDLSGRVVYSRLVSSQEFNNATHSVNTSSFENGIYFVNVTENGHRMTKRLIITR